jgi:hypothetical protein
VDVATRQEYIAEMQQLYYDAATYHILYYDSELHAARTDKFTGWVNQPPDTGTPLFGFGYSGYMALQDASLVPTPGPATAAPTVVPGATAGPTPTAVPGNTSGGISTPLILGALALIAIVAAGFWFMRQRRPKVEVE